MNTTLVIGVGLTVKVYDRHKNTYEEATILRVYDEDTYEKEHYPDGVPKIFRGRKNNEALVDVKFVQTNRVSRGHFVWALK